MKTKLISGAAVKILLVLCIFGSLSAEGWKQISGTNPYVHKIFFPDNNPSKVIVCSDALESDFSSISVEFPTLGHGYKFNNNGGDSFADFDTALVFFSVFDIIQLPDKTTTWIAAVRYFTNGGIVVTTDNGATWSKDQIRMQSPGQAVKLSASATGGKTRIFGAMINTIDDDGFVVTEDEFNIYKGSDSLKAELRDIAVSKANPSLLFAAADNIIPGNEGVYHSYNFGETWIKDIDGIKNLRILCVHPMSNNPAVVYCGADSIAPNGKSVGKGIYVSRDTGNTWIKAGVPGFAVYDIQEHPTNPNFLVAACDNGGVYVTSDGGLRWGPMNDGLPAGEPVRTIGIPSVEPNSQGITAFAGVHGTGLYKISRLISSVDENIMANGIKILGVFPQPIEYDVVVRFINPVQSNLKVYITDYLGRTVSNTVNEYFYEGEQSTQLYIDNPSSSMYNLVITDGKNIVTQKLMNVK